MKSLLVGAIVYPPVFVACLGFMLLLCAYDAYDYCSGKQPNDY